MNYVFLLTVSRMIVAAEYSAPCFPKGMGLDVECCESQLLPRRDSSSSAQRRRILPIGLTLSDGLTMPFPVEASGLLKQNNRVCFHCTHYKL